MPEDNSIYTKVVHAGEDQGEHFGAVSVPIYNASVFAFADAETGRRVHNYEEEGFFYGRLGNPTTQSLERAMRELEQGENALCFASGMAAVSAAFLSVLKSGDHLVAPRSIYATSNTFFNYMAENFGTAVTYVDQTDAQNYAGAIRPNTKALYIETPANPNLTITDIAAVTAIAKEREIVTIADNTFASPFNQNPLALGADLALHSATKYLGGHSDLTAGVLVGRKDLIEKARHKAAKLFGGNIAPQTAWLVLRGLRTLALRMERHNQNAQAIAEFLAGHEKVTAVYYPGLPEHKNHAIAKKQMRGFGGMIAFDVGTVEAGVAFLNALRLCLRATSLGGVETLAQHSASMTNAAAPREERLAAGISDGLIRLSVGIENADDLIRDLDNALRKA